ncbi:MAG: altronate dehydratase family protein [Planctomycetota bacterium]|nr:altronate dehydratase family protein [Planctomycetota bacterium]
MPQEAFASFVVVLHPADNVAVLKRAVQAGTVLTGGGSSITAAHDMPQGHKIAIAAVSDGAPVRKYGQVIGFARGGIAPGDHVHLHNLAMADFARDYQFCVDARPVQYYAADKRRYFQGYPRADGRAGTRNYVAIISSVNCSASVARFVADRFKTPEFRRDFPNVDGVVAFTHKSGCAAGDDAVALLQRTLAGMARHPNIYASLLLGLGCETCQVRLIAERHGLEAGTPRPILMTIQECGGISKTVEAATAALRKLLPAADAQRRRPEPLSKLVLAENCGGSDGNSGITANPALGLAADELVRHRGTVVLAETPEIYGAEHLLTRRAATREVGEKLVTLVRWWEEHARSHNATIDNNPTPGNKEGGLTNIIEKSLGAVAKGGQTPLMAVYEYAEQIAASGLCFMDTPGFDAASMTGLAAGGCTIGVFTTGRGSVSGWKPMPCIKVATNTALFERMSDDMDLNAGTILDGTETLEQVGARIFEKMIAVAGGERTKSELAGVGDEEFAPWELGPTF